MEITSNATSNGAIGVSGEITIDNKMVNVGFTVGNGDITVSSEGLVTFNDRFIENNAGRIASAPFIAKRVLENIICNEEIVENLLGKAKTVAQRQGISLKNGWGTYEKTISGEFSKLLIDRIDILKNDKKYSSISDKILVSPKGAICFEIANFTTNDEKLLLSIRQEARGSAVAKIMENINNYEESILTILLNQIQNNESKSYAKHVEYVKHRRISLREEALNKLLTDDRYAILRDKISIASLTTEDVIVEGVIVVIDYKSDYSKDPNILLLLQEIQQKSTEQAVEKAKEEGIYREEFYKDVIKFEHEFYNERIKECINFTNSIRRCILRTNGINAKFLGGNYYIKGFVDDAKQDVVAGDIVVDNMGQLNVLKAKLDKATEDIIRFVGSSNKEHILKRLGQELTAEKIWIERCKNKIMKNMESARVDEANRLINSEYKTLSKKVKFKNGCIIPIPFALSPRDFLLLKELQQKSMELALKKYSTSSDDEHLSAEHFQYMSIHENTETVSCVLCECLYMDRFRQNGLNEYNIKREFTRNIDESKGEVRIRSDGYEGKFDTAIELKDLKVGLDKATEDMKKCLEMITESEKRKLYSEELSNILKKEQEIFNEIENQFLNRLGTIVKEEVEKLLKSDNKYTSFEKSKNCGVRRITHSNTSNITRFSNKYTPTENDIELLRILQQEAIEKAKTRAINENIYIEDEGKSEKYLSDILTTEERYLSNVTKLIEPKKYPVSYSRKDIITHAPSHIKNRKQQLQQLDNMLPSIQSSISERVGRRLNSYLKERKGKLVKTDGITIDKSNTSIKLSQEFIQSNSASEINSFFIKGKFFKDLNLTVEREIEQELEKIKNQQDKLYLSSKMAVFNRDRMELDNKTLLDLKEQIDSGIKEAGKSNDVPQSTNSESKPAVVDSVVESNKTEKPLLEQQYSTLLQSLLEDSDSMEQLKKLNTELNKKCEDGNIKLFDDNVFNEDSDLSENSSYEFAIIKQFNLNTSNLKVSKLTQCSLLEYFLSRTCNATGGNHPYHQYYELFSLECFNNNTELLEYKLFALINEQMNIINQKRRSEGNKSPANRLEAFKSLKMLLEEKLNRKEECFEPIQSKDTQKINTSRRLSHANESKGEQAIDTSKRTRVKEKQQTKPSSLLNGKEPPVGKKESQVERQNKERHKPRHHKQQEQAIQQRVDNK
ncbi:MAG: hypothetical protein LBC92_00450 [Rickettsiales bacterium]|jgi:hypothetical protein|nr:hypothetical protein [Rickettsiales bacterium]